RLLVLSRVIAADYNPLACHLSYGSRLSNILKQPKFLHSKMYSISDQRGSTIPNVSYCGQASSILDSEGTCFNWQALHFPSLRCVQFWSDKCFYGLFGSRK